MIVAGLTGCPSTTPPPSDASIDFGHFRLDLGQVPNQSIDKQFVFYAGAAVQSFRFNLRVSGLQGRISVSSATGTLIQEITSNGSRTTNAIDGNVGLLRVQSRGLPEIIVDSLSVTRSTAPIVPTVSELSDRVSAFPFKLDQAVDVGFPAAPSFYYFSISGLHDGMIDIGYFGAGQLRIADPRDRDFPLSDSNLWDQVPRPGSSIPFTRVLVKDGDQILMAATNDAASSVTGHARIVIMATGAAQILSFPSATPWNFMAHPLGVDHDPTPGTRGPNGGALDCLNFENKRAIRPTPLGWAPVAGIPVCYDTHKGTDYLLRGGALAQGPDAPAGVKVPGVPVNAAASGVVLALDTGNVDKCFPDPLQNFAITCLGAAAPVDNFVAVRQDDGLIAHYVHVKRDSVVVVPGQRVVCGELLGQAASAGESATAHVHFELRRLRADPFTGPPWFNSLVLSDDRNDTVRFKGDTIDPFGDPTGAEMLRWKKITKGMPEFKCP